MQKDLSENDRRFVKRTFGPLLVLAAALIVVALIEALTNSY